MFHHYCKLSDDMSEDMDSPQDKSFNQKSPGAKDKGGKEKRQGAYMQALDTLSSEP